MMHNKVFLKATEAMADKLTHAARMCIFCPMYFHMTIKFFLSDKLIAAREAIVLSRTMMSAKM